jgi:hypothetical protein
MEQAEGEAQARPDYLSPIDYERNHAAALSSQRQQITAPSLAAEKIKVLNPKSVDDDGEQTEPLI